MKAEFFSGVSTALITPMKSGEIDFDSFKKLIRIQLESGVHGLVACGSTGEAATLSIDEKKRVLDFVLGEVSGQIPVLMGIGSSSTSETKSAAQIFESFKPSGFLVVTPPYNKPPQRGMVTHFGEVANSTKLPVILYNVPGRTSVKLLPTTVVEIAQKAPNVVGIKEAEGDVRVIEVLNQLCPETFTILSGDDGTFLESMTLGGSGVISVISNVAPKLCVKAFNEVKKSPALASVEYTQVLKPLVDAMFCESNPIPAKWALWKSGVIQSAEVRLPLVELDSPFHEQVLRATKGLE